MENELDKYELEQIKLRCKNTIMIMEGLLENSRAKLEELKAGNSEVGTPEWEMMNIKEREVMQRDYEVRRLYYILTGE